MQFELVRERLHALPRDLPAPPAVLMPIRIDLPEEFRTIDPLRRGRPAAVLVLLFPDEAGEGRVLLTARVPHLSAHAGEVSFPGGSAEPDDGDPVDTALREAAEEVGLDPSACGLQIVGALERVFIPVSGFRIVPVVGLATSRPVLRAAPEEVARILEAPVEAFLPDAPMELEERVIRERLVRFGVYPVEGERVWGATARMLGQLGALLAADTAAPAAFADVVSGTEAQWPLTGADITIRAAAMGDDDVTAFLEPLGPELARPLPEPAGVLLAAAAGRVAGIAGWGSWDRSRPPGEPRGFGGLEVPAGDRAAELTLLAVAPAARGQGIGRRLAEAVAGAARDDGARRLLAWTLADTAVTPAAAAARAFFRSNGFRDLAVDRRVLSGGEDRLLLERFL